MKENDDLKDDIKDDIKEALMVFLSEYHSKRDYFECHEILEHKWKEKPQGERDEFWTALLQIAVSNYHYRRGNIGGAKKLMERAKNKIIEDRGSYEMLGFDYENFKGQVIKMLYSIENNIPYESINLSLTKKLEEDYLNYCKDKSLLPFTKSDLKDLKIVNRHLKENR